MSNEPIPPAAFVPEPPVPEGAPTATYHPEEATGTMIGPYRLLQKLGKGGMGVVWMAEQREPVQRYVAIKIIKASLHGDQVLARFEAERQALAMMDHPNIARVLDAGATAAGGPYFVMELVKGIPFTKYCDQEHLTPAERLALFIPVCNAVQHAHQKGIIHRDLKPSNVLIALYDGKPVPKVIDFGVAKATTQKLTERTMFTEVGQIVGTLEYMAPEQAELNNLDIDTRADIYSLGVMLYELLTGATPFSSKQLRGEAFLEMLRLIREVEPAKPSTKLSKSEELPAIAAKRKLEPKKLSRLVQGDLDWIVMKCLEKERARRYETANQLGDELNRYLADEPVQAGPPSVRYRAKKFLRRNKGPVIAATLVFLALISGITGTTASMIRAQDAEDLASKRLTDLENANAKTSKALEDLRIANGVTENALKEARESLRQTEMVSSFVVETYISRNSLILDHNAAGKKILDEGIRRLESNVIVSPMTKGNLLHGLGVLSLQSQQPAKAIEILEKALAVRQTSLGREHLDTCATMDVLAEAYREGGKSVLAVPLCEETVKVRTAKLGPNHTDTLMSRWGLALAYNSDKQYEKAIPLLEEGLWYLSTLLGEHHYRTEDSRSLLIRAYHAGGKGDKAVRLLDEALKSLKGTPDKPWALRSIANAFEDIGQDVKAEPFRRDEVERARKPNDWEVTQSLAELGLNLLRQKKYAEVEPLLRECLQTRVKLQPDAWSTFNTKSMLGASLLGQKKYKAAEPLLKDGYEGMKQREQTVPPYAKVRLTEGLERLVELYDATGIAAEADRWRKELAARNAAYERPKK